MTQIKKNSEFQGSTIEPARSAINSDKDSLAQRKDIVELHNRLAGMLNSFNSSLGKGIVKKTAQDRAELVAKLDEVESSVNKMEGTLRIELEPMLRDLVVEAVSQQSAPRPRSTIRVLAILAIFAAGMGFGITYPAQIKDTSSALVAKISDTWTSVQTILPLNGGSRTSRNQAE